MEECRSLPAQSPGHRRSHKLINSERGWKIAQVRTGMRRIIYHAPDEAAQRFQPALTSNATAWAASPSSLPMKPMRSVVVALTLTFSMPV